MIRVDAAYGLLAHAFIFGALAALPTLGVYRARVALAATALSLMIGIAPILLAVFGPPSITLLGLALWRLNGRPAVPSTARAALPVAGIGGLLMLGEACGLPGLYGLGYQPWAILAVLLPIGVILWAKHQTPWLLILAAGLQAYAGGLFANLWGALLDPLLVLLACCELLHAGHRRFSAPARH